MWSVPNFELHCLEEDRERGSYSLKPAPWVHDHPQLEEHPARQMPLDHRVLGLGTSVLAPSCGKSKGQRPLCLLHWPPSSQRSFPWGVPCSPAFRDRGHFKQVFFLCSGGCGEPNIDLLGMGLLRVRRGWLGSLCSLYTQGFLSSRGREFWGPA